MRRFLIILACASLGGRAMADGNVSAASPAAESPATVLVAVGAAGEEDFGSEFVKWANDWKTATEQAHARSILIGLAPTNATPDWQQFKQALSDEPTNTPAELWIVLIGHGTFDGKEAKFNLRGPDLSATELAEWLKPFRRPVIVIQCASSSSPFLNKLAAPNRVVVTATRSGYEENYARFGRYMAQAITDPTADLDKDGQTSVLEAFLIASRRVAEFYETEGRLATEHPLLDDNGDGLGTPADFFRGIRAVKKPAGGGTVDGLRAHQIHLLRSADELKMPAELRARRDDLELAVARLRETRAQFTDDEYYARLETLMRQLAKIYEAVGRPAGARKVEFE